MKIIILAGGFGTRLSEYTDTIPKPMVTIGGKPIIFHIMNHYAKYGFKEFYIALGYKSEIIKDYFLNYRTLNSDFTIDLGTGDITHHNFDNLDWKITLVNTGENTMTGGRIKRVQNFIGNETCMLTYGDGVSDVNIKELLKFHNTHKKLVTVTAVRPHARFGELEITEDYLVENFKEKPQINNGWINGGFFVLEPEFFSYIEGDNTFLEKEPLEIAAQKKQLIAYKHSGFWQCMDTKRDRDSLEESFINKIGPWK
jgi:glucose-1-phosphate cytidylyltransferase